VFDPSPYPERGAAAMAMPVAEPEPGLVTLRRRSAGEGRR